MLNVRTADFFQPSRVSQQKTSVYIVQNILIEDDFCSSLKRTYGY